MAANTSTSVDDELALLLLGVVGAPVLIGFLVANWHRAVSWAVDAGVLVSARAKPVVGLPGADGAGLDVPRLAIVVGVVGLLLVGLGMLGRRVWRRHQVIR